MKRTYEVRDRADKRAIREFLKREGQFLLPMLELVEQTEVAIDEVIQVMGRATIEAVLEMSAEGVAGVKQAGRSRAEDDTVWYGRQGGVVYLSDRKVRVERPRLRRLLLDREWRPFLRDQVGISSVIGEEHWTARTREMDSHARGFPHPHEH